MTNIFNFCCPGCGETDQIDIQALVWVRLTGDGTDADESHEGDHVWTDSSLYFCGHCETSGRVSELRNRQGG
jgi:hypothetical protein